MSNFEKAKYYFEKNLWTTKMLQNLVIKGKLSQEEFDAITSTITSTNESDGVNYE